MAKADWRKVAFLAGSLLAGLSLGGWIGLMAVAVSGWVLFPAILDFVCRKMSGPFRTVTWRKTDDDDGSGALVPVKLPTPPISGSKAALLPVD